MGKAQVMLPAALHPVFAEPRSALRYRGAFGGRGSGKSFSFAMMAVLWGYREKLRILATRELQFSIKESFYAELKRAIESQPFLASHYTFTQHGIRGKNGTEFIFRGLRHNMSSIKSMAQIDLCIVEEAEDIPEQSWIELEPTIRAPGSEIWVIWNPRVKGSPVDIRLRQNPPPRSMVVEVNYEDNPWFPTELEEQRQHAIETLDPALYRHIWEGAYYEQSEAQVFAGRYEIRSFTPGENWDGPYFGLDFGFAIDPTAGIKSWVYDDCLYIEYDFSQVKLELDETVSALIEALPDVERHTIRADSARPESISYLSRKGLPGIEACKKGKGSVEDGIEFIKSFKKIIIHERCKDAQSEFGLYSYKTDRLSGDILPQLVDANNHVMDALRYALEPIMKSRITSGVMIPRRLRK